MNGISTPRLSPLQTRFLRNIAERGGYRVPHDLAFAGGLAPSTAAACERKGCVKSEVVGDDLVWTILPAGRAATSTARGVLIWADPPEQDLITPSLPDIDHDFAAWKMRTHPGKWAVIAVTEPIAYGALQSLAARIMKGNPVAYRPGGSFEACVRHTGDHSRLYVRFNPDPDDHPDEGER